MDDKDNNDEQKHFFDPEAEAEFRNIIAELPVEERLQIIEQRNRGVEVSIASRYLNGGFTNILERFFPRLFFQGGGHQIFDTYGAPSIFGIQPLVVIIYSSWSMSMGAFLLRSIVQPIELIARLTKHGSNRTGLQDIADSGLQDDKIEILKWVSYGLMVLSSLSVIVQLYITSASAYTRRREFYNSLIWFNNPIMIILMTINLLTIIFISTIKPSLIILSKTREEIDANSINIVGEYNTYVLVAVFIAYSGLRILYGLDAHRVTTVALIRFVMVLMSILAIAYAFIKFNGYQ